MNSPTRISPSIPLRTQPRSSWGASAGPSIAARGREAECGQRDQAIQVVREQRTESGESGKVGGHAKGSESVGCRSTDVRPLGLETVHLYLLVRLAGKLIGLSGCLIK